MRLQLRKVDFDDAVVVRLRVGFAFRVGGQQVAVLLGQVGQPGAAGRPQVSRHPRIVGENRGGGPQFGAHIGDRRLAGGADRGRAGAEVFDDGVGAAGNGQFPGQIQDDVFGRGPAAHFPGKADADKAGVKHFPRQAGHHLHGIGPADADGQRTQPAAHGGMGIGAQHQLAGIGVVLKGYLMNDAGPRRPKPDAIFGRRGAQKVVDFIVFRQRFGQIPRSFNAGLDQMVAMHRGRHCGGGAAGLHELEHRRLPQHILQDHPVGAQLDVGLPPHHSGSRRVVQVAQQDFVGQGKGAALRRPYDIQVLVQGLVHPGDDFRGWLDGNQSKPPPAVRSIRRAGPAGAGAFPLCYQTRRPAG